MKTPLVPQPGDPKAREFSARCHLTVRPGLSQSLVHPPLQPAVHEQVLGGDLRTLGRRGSPGSSVRSAEGVLSILGSVAEAASYSSSR